MIALPLLWVTRPMGTSGKKASRNLSKQGSSTFGKAMTVLTAFSLPRADCLSTSPPSFHIQCFHFGSYLYTPLTFLHSFLVTLILHLKVCLLLLLPQRILCHLLLSFFSLLVCSPCHYSLSCRCKSLVPSLPGSFQWRSPSPFLKSINVMCLH